MGFQLMKFEFSPEKNEQIDTTIILQEETRSVIHGVVKDKEGNFVCDAVVKLFEMPNPRECCTLIPITHTFTDECGQFLFGPLCADKKYIVKVWFSKVKIKKVESVPFKCNQGHGQLPCQPCGSSRDC